MHLVKVHGPRVLTWTLQVPPTGDQVNPTAKFTQDPRGQPSSVGIDHAPATISAVHNPSDGWISSIHVSTHPPIPGWTIPCEVPWSTPVQKKQSHHSPPQLPARRPVGTLGRRRPRAAMTGCVAHPPSHRIHLRLRATLLPRFLSPWGNAICLGRERILAPPLPCSGLSSGGTRRSRSCSFCDQYPLSFRD
jgi:hypothetical protein